MGAQACAFLPALCHTAWGPSQDPHNHVSSQHTPWEARLALARPRQLQAAGCPRGSSRSEGQVGWATGPAGCWEGGRTQRAATLGFLPSLKGLLV